MTMTQFEKRKLKELEAEVAEKRAEKREKSVSKKEEPAVELTEKAYDIVNIEGKPNIVIIAYSLESKEIKIETISPISKSIAMPFANKKKALQTLTRDLYKIEK